MTQGLDSVSHGMTDRLPAHMEPLARIGMVSGPFANEESSEQYCIFLPASDKARLTSFGKLKKSLSSWTVRHRIQDRIQALFRRSTRSRGQHSRYWSKSLVRVPLSLGGA